MHIDGKSRLVGVFGYPVSHSLSPIMHNALLRKLGIHAVYVPLPVAPDHLADAIRGFRAMGFIGANVTLPHKEAILPHLDHLSPLSRFMGSVNTLYWEGHHLCGTTTDSWGALRNLEDAGVALEGTRVGLLGAGGAARAIAFALLSGTMVDGREPQPAIAQLTILGRNRDKLEALQFDLERAGLVHGNLRVATLGEFQAETAELDIIINATSVGMHPDDHAVPLDTQFLREGQVVYDIVYTPRETRLLREAKVRGCRTVEGLGMLVHQGALSFEKWFQIPADTSVMRAALEDHLSHK